MESSGSHFSKDNITGNLIRTSLEATKLELGLPRSVLSQNYSRHGFLVTKTWCTHTWEFLHSNGIRIEDKVAELPLQRENNQYLMVAFALAPFTDPERSHLNRCRIFLQAVTLANISTGDGTQITQSAWMGIVDDLGSSKISMDEAGRPNYLRLEPMATSSLQMFLY